MKIERLILPLLGVIFTSVGVALLLFFAPLLNQEAERVERLPSLTATALAEGPPGREGLLEGRISERNPTYFRSFVAYVRYEYQGRDNDNTSLISAIFPTTLYLLSTILRLHPSALIFCLTSYNSDNTIKTKLKKEGKMRWFQVREIYPEQWLVIEALEAHTEGDRRLLDRIAVVEVCPDGTAAMQSYRQLHQQFPLREFYFVHTGRENLDIRERRWIGIRRNSATNPAR